MSNLFLEPSAASPELQKLLAAAFKNEASDLHLKVGSPPLFRIQGRIVRTKSDPLTKSQIDTLLASFMGPEFEKRLATAGSVDFAFGLEGVGRFRINIFRQRGALSMAARRVQNDVPTLEELHLPEALRTLANMNRGLIMIGGNTGSGKSTTLAALVRIINESRPVHIITIEDPIEYLHRDQKAFVNQREIGIDVPSYQEGLKYALRQDPDVILIGELRDHETIETALMASETGHLVLATIHATSASQTIGRLLDFFPSGHHHQIRQLLYHNLAAVVVQELIQGARPGVPQVPAVEIMIVNPIIRKLIQTGEDNKIIDIIRTDQQGLMQDLNHSLHSLVKQGLIREKTAIEAAPNPDQLEMILKGIVLGSDRGTIVG